MSSPYRSILLNELHIYLPDLLYRTERFHTVQDVLQYIVHVADISPYQMARAEYRSASAPAPAPARTTSYSMMNSLLSSFLAPQPVQPIPSVPRVPEPRTSSTSRISLSDILQALLSPSRGTEEELRGPTQEELQQGTVVFHMDSSEQKEEKSEQKEELVCAICQDALVEGQFVRRICHCNHSFHRHCLDVWFSNHTTCPTCRYDIRVPHVDHHDHEENENEDENQDEEPIIMVNIRERTVHRHEH